MFSTSAGNSTTADDSLAKAQKKAAVYQARLGGGGCQSIM